MALVVWLLSLGMAVAQKLPSYYLPSLDEEYTVNRLESRRNPSPPTQLQVTQYVMKLKRAEAAWSISSGYVQAIRRQVRGPRATDNTSIPIINTEAGSVFLAPITVGGQNFDVVVDTGSSDPWLVVSGFTCINVNSGQPQTETACNFGTPYNSTASPTYTVLPNENFNITYSDSEEATGTMGYDTFTLGGITVPSQEFALVNWAAWLGDGISSGLVGFAYSLLTSAHPGNDPAQDVPGQVLTYNTLFTNMYTNQGIPPIFSLAIDRDPSQGGVLGIGGIPDIPHTPYFASTPIIPIGVNASNNQPVYEYYSIQVGGYAVSSSPSAQFNVLGNTNPLKVTLMENATQAIIDSGTSLIYAPDDVAAAVIAAFTPPGYFDQTTQLYFVGCNARPPQFGVAIGEKIFFVNPLDMVLQQNQTACISGVQPDQGGLTILGDVWMKNVLAVFDLGAEQMRFAAREFYGMTEKGVAAST